MAFYSAAASHVLKPLSFRATAVAAAYAAAPISPPNGGRVPATTVGLELLISSTGLLNTDVEIVVDNDATFASPVYSNTLTNRADGPTSVIIGGLVNGTTYRWRMRAAETGTAGWSAWSPVWLFTPDTNSGKAIWYSDLNIAPVSAPQAAQAGTWYMDENIGPGTTVTTAAVQYHDENVGFPVTSDSRGYAAAAYGDVNELTPEPHIWFLKPKSGRPGDGIRIICFGVGDLQSTFSGLVDAYYGPVLGWQPVPVIGWQTYPPTEAAYTGARLIDELAELIDMQHTVIEITVPLTALSPGMPVRIRTDGP